MTRSKTEIVAIEHLEFTPGRNKQVVLRRRGEHLDVIVDQVVLLSSAALETEVTFGALARRIAERPTPRVLIGGLGFGGTLRGALEVLPSRAEVVVAERLAVLPRWLAAPPAGAPAALALGHQALSDPRVTMFSGDVFTCYAHDAFDAILLDVDNGPSWATFRDNAKLYGIEGLRRAHASLRNGGIFAVWSGAKEDAFLGRLREANLRPECVPLLEGQEQRARAYLGTRAQVGT
jgi:spermidine synthase